LISTKESQDEVTVVAEIPTLFPLNVAK